MKPIQSANPLVREATARMQESGIVDAEILRERYDPQHFGNAEAIFQIGVLVVRFVRDRGQDFVDLGSIRTPGKFYQFDDVDVAMGWQAPHDVVDKRRPEPLSSIMERLVRHRAELEHAFSAEHENLMRSQIEKAASARAKVLFGRSSQ